jgi:hypothetical protein
MPCQTIRGPGGFVAIACTRGPARKVYACRYCGKPARLLCDFPLAAIGVEAADGRKTCDAHVCAACSVLVAPNTNYCKVHHVTERVKGERPVFGRKP